MRCLYSIVDNHSISFLSVLSLLLIAIAVGSELSESSNLYSSSEWRFRLEESVSLQPTVPTTNETWSISPNLPPNLSFIRGVISGDPATRTKRTEYLVTMTGSMVRNQTLWIEIYSEACPEEGEWPNTFDRTTVSRSCSFGLGRKVRTCYDGKWEDVHSDCMWVNLFFLVSAVSLLLVLFSFGSLVSACCRRCRRKESPVSSPSIEMVPSSGNQQSSETAQSVSKNPFDVPDADPSSGPVGETSHSASSSVNIPIRTIGNPFLQDSSPSDSANGSTENPPHDSSIHRFAREVTNPFASAYGETKNVLSDNTTYSASANTMNNTINNTTYNTSTNTTYNAPANTNHHPTIPPKPTGLAALMGLTDTSFTPPPPRNPPMRDETPSTHDEMPRRPERSPPQLAESPFVRPHRPAPTLDNGGTAPQLPPKPIKPPKPAKPQNRTSSVGMRFVPCPEWMALTAGERENEETFLRQLSHRNIVKFVGVTKKDGKDCVEEEDVGPSLEAFLAENTVDDAFVIGVVESVLYAMRYVYGVSELPYGSLATKNVYVNERKEACIGLPLLRTVVRQQQITVEDDLKQLNAIITTLAAKATKPATQRELRLCGLLCLSQSDASAVENILERLRSL